MLDELLAIDELLKAIEELVLTLELTTLEAASELELVATEELDATLELEICDEDDLTELALDARLDAAGELEVNALEFTELTLAAELELTTTEELEATFELDVDDATKLELAALEFNELEAAIDELNVVFELALELKLEIVAIDDVTAPMLEAGLDEKSELELTAAIELIVATELAAMLDVAGKLELAADELAIELLASFTLDAVEEIAVDDTALTAAEDGVFAGAFPLLPAEPPPHAERTTHTKPADIVLIFMRYSHGRQTLFY